MVQIYKKKWERSFIPSFLGYVRDSLVLYLPVKKLPEFFVKLLYGDEFKFAFLVHPRSYQDVFISMPAFKIFKLLWRRKKGFNFFANTNPFVLNTVKTNQNVNGLVIAQLTVPEVMFEKRRETIRMLEKCLRLVSKICAPGTVVGLGGWFPMITKRGAALDEYANRLHLVVTNGHCGTLASIYMMVERISKISETSLSEMTLAVIGIGKMGANVARAFNGRVKKIILIDVNKVQLDKIKEELSSIANHSSIDCILSTPKEKTLIRHALKECNVGICATSSYRNILTLKDIPPHFIGIDDSRPEALPRDPTKERIVLEGGLLKIGGARINYNYGFGEDDNVFGCLGEAFLVALAGPAILRPTLGDVDKENFFKLLSFCKTHGVTEGDLKSSHINITDEDIKYALESQRYR